MVLECTLEHRAHIASPDLGGGKCSTAGCDLWDAEGEAPWSPFRVLLCWGRVGAPQGRLGLVLGGGSRAGAVLREQRGCQK